MQPVSGRSPTQGGPHPMQGILEPKQGCLHPMQGTCTPPFGQFTPLPFVAMSLPQYRPGMDSLQLPGTSSSAPSTSVQSHEDTVSPFLSQTEVREFRDSDDCESESEEEAEAVSNKGKFTLSAQSAKLLTEVTAKPLKNTKSRQLLDRYPQPAECDQVYPPKLDESISLIIPHSSRKEDTLLSRLQEQLAEGGTTADPKNASITFLGNAVAHFNLERRKSAMKHLNKDLQPLAKGA